MTQLIALLLSFTAWANGPADIACDHALSIDQRLARWRETHDDSSVMITHLINQAWLPTLHSFRDEVLTWTAANVNTAREAQRARAIQDQGIAHEFKAHLAHIIDIGAPYDAFYQGRFHYDYMTEAPYTDHNRAVMFKMLRAVGLINDYVDQHWPTAEPCATFASAHQTLRENSFSRDNLTYGLQIGNSAVLAAAAQLTSDPVEGFTAEELLRAVTREENGQPSPMIRLALTYPPGLLGRNGDKVYVKSPLVRVDGSWRFSRALHYFLNTTHRSVQRRGLRRYELGHGCPVAHRTRGSSGSGLQAYVDAVMHVYRLLD